MEGLLLLLILLVPAPEPSARTLMDFSRLAKASGKEIALIDKDGTVREGRLLSATADDVTIGFASGQRVFAKADVNSVDRLRDSNVDGVIRGAAFGAVLGLIVFGGYDVEGEGVLLLRAAGTYAVIGWALDAANKHRQPIYRAKPPAKRDPAAKPGLRFSFRF